MNIDAVYFKMHLYSNLVKYGQFYKNFFSQVNIKNYVVKEFNDVDINGHNYYIRESLWNILYRFQKADTELKENNIKYEIDKLTINDRYCKASADGYVKLFEILGNNFYLKNPSFKLFEKFKRIETNTYSLCFGAATINDELKYLFMNFQYDLLDNKRLKNLYLKVFNTEEDIFKVYKRIL